MMAKGIPASLRRSIQKLPKRGLRKLHLTESGGGFGFGQLTTHMRKLLTLFLLSLMVVSTGWAQEKAAAYRAQGRYYSAKEAFDAKRFDDAARMLRESREMLGGKSNIRLQFLLVYSLYNAGRFKEAQVEMNSYLTLIERSNPEKYANFPQDVDALTNDETRAITMIIDKIDSEVANDTEGKMAAERRVAAERQEAAKKAALLESKRSSALAELKASVIKEFTGAEARVPWQGPYMVSITLSGGFRQLRIEVLGKSEQTHNSRNQMIPMSRNRSSATVDLARLRAYKFVKIAPGREVNHYRAASGQRVAHSYRWGGRVDDVLCGIISDGDPTLFVELAFDTAFEHRFEIQRWNADGDMQQSDSYTNSTKTIMLPVSFEDVTSGKLAAILALK